MRSNIARVFDNVVSLFIILIVFLIIIRLPPWLLDVFLLLNISLSLIILLISMYIKESLEFSIFPSLLLITTLFRIAMNVSSSRLILGEFGQAGAVIKTFGDFVVGGNLGVGFVIFIIILVIQFLVIVKGSERVAEVAARFTLDAMPGKQMSIDADLSTGVITEQQAKERREKISREAEFYGAMDGATKFVKGDAIVAIILSIINIIGGLIIGALNGVENVLEVYTIATIGDGLVSQIPALLISTATGMVVTRSASENSLSKDVITQFARMPVAMLITSGAMLVLSLIQGMPKAFLIILGLGWAALGLFQIRSRSKALKAAQEAEMLAAEEPVLTDMEIYSDPQNIYADMDVEPLEIEFGYSLLSMIDDKQGSNFKDRIIKLKKKFAFDMGIVINVISLVDNITIVPNSYVIKIKGEEVAGGEILPNYYLIMDSAGTFADIDGVDTVDPAFGIPAKWIPTSSVERAEMLGYAVIDPPAVIITHLSDVIKRHAHELVGRNEIDEMLDNVRKKNKTLVDDLIGQAMSVPAFQKIVTNLLREQIPVKDLTTIIETIAEYYQASGGDLDMLTEYCRQALKRTITRLYAEEGSLKAVMMDPELEKVILKGANKTAAGVYLDIDPATIQGILSSLSDNLAKLDSIGAQPIVLTNPLVRIYFKQFIDQFVPGLTVLSTSEIDPKVQLQAVGVIKADAA
ncbi:MAG: flagellar biosynthesis protein FlhA [Oscillospiraceae bacterium]|nr:flagellar biosynthesis protein FlhA [Oscillospiraceae bacterium]